VIETLELLRFFRSKKSCAVCNDPLSNPTEAHAVIQRQNSLIEEDKF